MSELANTRVKLQTLLSRLASNPVIKIGQEDDIKKKIQMAENFFNTLLFNANTPKDIQRLDRYTSQAIRANQIVCLIESDQSITKVEQSIEAINLSDRSLQRLFKNHVGVSPKWLIRKFRMHEI